MRRYIFCLTVLGSLFLHAQAMACDLCGAHVCSCAECAGAEKLGFGVTEQYSHYGRLQHDGEFVDNAKDQYLSSSITNIFIESVLNDDVTLQVNLPYIDRSYRTIEDSFAKKGSESGLGDLTILARYSAIKEKRKNGLLWLQFVAGLELPTGDSDALKEHEHGAEVSEAVEEEHEHADEAAVHEHFQTVRHGEVDHSDGAVEAAIHGHDIALGSGSVDVPLGFVLTYQNETFHGVLDARYTFRNEGDHDYEFADDLRWSASAAFDVYSEGEQRANLGLSIWGEHKGRDKIGELTENDTGMNMVGFGPLAQVVLQRSLILDLGVDIPINRDNTGIQAVLDYRLRGALSYRF